MRPILPCALLPLFALVALASLAPPLSAQQGREILGSTANAANRSAVAKGNSLRIDSTVVLESFEMWLDFRGSQDLRFSVLRSYGEAGTYEQVASVTVPTNGQGARWYSSGALDLYLLCGSHYVLAVSWPGSVSYFFSTADTQALSFGAHTFAYAVGMHPLPSSIATSSNDFAVYYMALRTHVPGAQESDASCSGESCATSANQPPELGLSGPPRLGDASFEMQLFGAPPGTLGTVFLAPTLLATPLPIAGSCELYLDLGTAFYALGTATFDAALLARFPYPLPTDGSLRGQTIALQGFAVDPAAGALDTSNALEVRLY